MVAVHRPSSILPSLGLLSLIALVFLGAAFSESKPLQQEGKLEPKLRMVLETGGHNSDITSILYSADGERMYTVSLDKTIRIWAARSGAMLQVIRLQATDGKEGKIYAFALSPDESTLAVGGWGMSKHGGEVRLVSLSTGRVTDLPSHRNGVASIRYLSPDLIASGGLDGQVILQNPSLQNSKVHKLDHAEKVDWFDNRDKAPACPVSHLALNPSRTTLATAVFGHTKIALWSMGASPKQTGLLSTGTEPIGFLGWKEDGVLLTMTRNGAASLWRDGIEERLTDRSDDNSIGVLSPDRKTLVRASDDGVLEEVDLGTKAVRRVADLKKRVTALGFSPSGKILSVAGGPEHSVVQLDVRTGEAVAVCSGSGIAVQSLAFQGETHRLHVQRVDQESPGLIFDLGKMEVELRDNLPNPSAAAPVTDGRSDTIKLEDGRVAIHRNDAQEVVLQTRAAPGQDRALSWCWAGPYIAVGTNFDLLLYRPTDARGGKLAPFANLIGHLGPITTLSCSKDGKYLASGSSDQTVRLWRLADLSLSSRNGPDGLAPVKPYLSLFYGRPNDWVVWHPSGYHFRSPGFRAPFGWQEDGDGARVATFYPAANYESALHRHDVLAALTSALTLDEALKKAESDWRLASGERRERERKITLEIDSDLEQVRTHILSLEKEIAGLEPGRVDVAAARQAKERELRSQRQLEKALLREREITAREVRNKDYWMARGLVTSEDLAAETPIIKLEPNVQGNVRYRVESKGATVETLSVFADGSQIMARGIAGNSPMSSSDLEREIDLPSDTREVTVVVRTTQNVSSGATAVLARGALPTTSANTAKANGRLFFIGLAVDEFDYFSKLGYAVSDALALEKTFLERASHLYTEVIPYRLHGPSATAEELQRVFNEIEQKDPQVQDWIVMFVGTHGIVKGKNFYVALQKTHMDKVATTALPFMNYFDDLDANPKILILLDSCHAGATAVYSKIPDMDKADDPKPFFIFAACSQSESSYEHPDWKGGAFAQTVVEVIQTSVNGLTEGIDLDALEGKVKSDVKEKAQRKGLKQNPKIIPPFGADANEYFLFIAKK